MKNLTLLLLLLAFLNACHSARTEHPSLSRAEQIMNAHPDSALSLLENIQQPENLSAEDYATWCLLLTQAQDKKDGKHTSDSLINVAVKYFEKRKDPLHYAKALYYKGRVCQDQKKIEEAAEFFVKALDVGQGCQDYNLLFLIYSQLGTLYGYQDLAEYAMESYQKAYHYAVLSGDSSCLSFAYSYIGRAYSLSGEWDQSLSYYEKGLSVAIRIKDTHATQLAMNEYVNVCVYTDRTDQIKDYADILLEAKEEEYDKTGNLEQFYLVVGDLYREIRKFDEALFYLPKSLQSENLYTLAGSSKSLYFLYEELKQYDKAVQYNNMYWMYADSIQKLERCNAILEIKAKYDNEKIQRENLQLKLKNYRLITVSVVGLLVVLGVIFAIVKIYRRKMADKILQISDLETRLKEVQEKSTSILQEQEDIQSKVSTLNNQIETLKREYDLVQNAKKLLENTGESQQKELDNLSKQLAEKSASINQMKELRTALIGENKKLEEKNQELKQTIRLLQGNISKLSVTKNQETLNAVSFALIIKMKKEKAPLNDDEWTEFFMIVNLLHNNFVDRLSASFPKLKVEDLKLCSLTKQTFTNEDISSILEIQEDALIKRKQRLCSKFGKEQWDKGGFNAYIKTY